MLRGPNIKLIRSSNMNLKKFLNENYLNPREMNR